jgi:hypothetical protein
MKKGSHLPVTDRQLTASQAGFDMSRGSVNAGGERFSPPEVIIFG